MSGEAESAGQVRSWDTNTMPWEIRHIDELDGDLAAKQLIEDPDTGMSVMKMKYCSLGALPGAYLGERPRAFGTPTPSDAPLGVPDGLVGEEGEAVTDGPGTHQPHRFLVTGLAEEALTGPEHDREDDQP
jgi:hypothetical protein